MSGRRLGLQTALATALTRSLGLAMANGVISVFNVKTDYGAQGDGVTDDTTAFQNAINAACAAKGMVYVPPVNTSGYLVGSLTIPSPGDLKIFGAGAQSILLYKTGVDRCIIYQESFGGTVSRANVWIEGLNFLGTGIGVAGGGNNQRGAIWLDSVSNVVIKDCIITDFRDVAINIWPKSNVKVINNRIERCCTTDQGWNAINWMNLRVADQDNVGEIWILNNYVNGIQTGGISASFNSPSKPTVQLRAYVMGNTTKDCGWTGIALEASYCQDVIIANNQMYYCWNGLEVSTGGNTQFSTPQPNYVVVTGNLVDAQNRSTGVTGVSAGMVLTGSRILATNNMIRHYKAGLLIDRSDSDSLAEDITFQGNVLEAHNGDTTDTNLGISLKNGRGCSILGNQVHRWKTTVKTNQTVAAGGTLQVGTVEGCTSTGSITVNGTQYVYTAIAQAGQAVNATFTLTAGGTFTDGQEVLVGGHGRAVGIDSSKDCLIVDNLIRNPGEAGITTGGTGNSNNTIMNNKIINPWSQNRAGTKVGISLAGTSTDHRVEGNEIYDITGTAEATIGIDIGANETRVALRGNLVDGITTAYQTAATVQMDRDNRKSKTDTPNMGTASVANGNTVNHGLLGTPTHVSVTPTVAKRIANVTAKSATTFTVSLHDDTGTAIAVAENVTWEARI